MRVNHPSGNAVQPGEAGNAKKSERASGANETKGVEKRGDAEAEKTSDRSGARAEISQKSKDFAHAKAVASDTPEVREERIAELKKRIAEGHYKVDADAVADRMVDDHLKMSGIG